MTATATLLRGMRPAICETRLGKVEDLAFVVNCWVNRLGREDKMRTGDAKRHVRSLLGRELSRLLVAHVPGEPDAILGWAATEDGRPPCIHYVYVRDTARRQGVARALIGIAPSHLEYSHRAPRGVVLPTSWTLNIDRAKT